MTSTSKRSALAAFLGAAIALSSVGVGAASAAQIDLCGSLAALQLLDGTTLCTHGNDDQLLPMDTLDVPVAPVTSTAIEVVQDIAPVAEAVTAPLLEAVTAPATPAVDGLLSGSVLSPAPAAQDDPQAQAVANNESPAGNAADGAVPSLPAECIGNGADGHRVQLLALQVGGSQTALADDADLRRWAGQVTWTFRASAERDGAERLVRWVTDATEEGCEVAITRVDVEASEVDGFSNTIKALDARGFNRRDRKYLAFVNVSDGICGMGTVPLDDRADAGNASNRTTGYSRIDAPCWTTGDAGFYSVAAHELTHNLGGVQNSAPNASGGYHCTDEWDLMCYADGSSDVSHRCTDDNEETGNEGDHHNRLLDCGANDYFNASDEVSGYLADHWNVADSLFLDGRPTATGTTEPSQEEPREQPSSDEAEGSTAAALVGTGSNALQTLVNWVLDLFGLLSGEGLLRA